MPPPLKTLTRNRAWSCVLINQAATPGLGSLMGRRFLAGSLQLLLALAGFGMICGWMGKYFYNVMRQQMDQPVSASPANWLGKWGVIFFAASWLWSGITSISLLRQSQAEEAKVPPRITNPPA